MPSFEQCYRVLRSRDQRFDGWIYACVRTTGIYCRPSCPANTPKAANVRFVATAAAAQEAGFRACRRCRPDAVPGSPEWDLRADVAARAMRLVDDGAVEREGVAGLAGRLGYTTRHLNRLLTAELGAGPLALARARRAHTARLLLETTRVPVTDVAFAAGFGSVRQFNDTIRAVFAATPSEVRSRAKRAERPAPSPATASVSASAGPAAGAAAGPAAGAAAGLAAGSIRLRLPFREPYDADAVLTYLDDRLLAGVEELTGRTYRRTLRLPGGHGIVELTPTVGYVRCDLRLADLRDLGTAVARCRRMLHLDADPSGVAEVLGDDELLGPLVRKSPGLRVPGTVDPFEVAMRAVVGQQISVRAARSVLGGIVERYGRALALEDAGGLCRVFPEPEALTDVDGLAMPASRGRTIRALATAVADGQVDLEPGTDRSAAIAGLLALPGVGPWTAQYVALRGLGDPDAFPGTDLGIRQTLVALGVRDDPRAIDETAERWRPLRSWAAQHLWSAETGSAHGAIEPAAGKRRTVRRGRTPEGTEKSR